MMIKSRAPMRVFIGKKQRILMAMYVVLFLLIIYLYLRHNPFENDYVALFVFLVPLSAIILSASEQLATTFKIIVSSEFIEIEYFVASKHEPMIQKKRFQVGHIVAVETAEEKNILYIETSKRTFAFYCQKMKEETIQVPVDVDACAIESAIREVCSCGVRVDKSKVRLMDRRIV